MYSATGCVRRRMRNCWQAFPWFPRGTRWRGSSFLCCSIRHRRCSRISTLPALYVLDAEGTWVLDALHQRRGDHHEEAACDDRVDAVVVQEVDHDPAEEESRQDFRGDDEEVEDTHVDAGSGGWQRSGQN